MSAAAFFSDVVECRRLLGHYQRIQDEVKNRGPARRYIRALLPWVLALLLALPWWQWVEISPVWGLALLFMAAFSTLTLNSPRKLTTFEALHMPSRRALFVARLLPWLPWWLWIGLLGTAGILVALWPDVPSAEQAVVWLLIGAQVPWLVVGVFSLPKLAPVGCAAFVIWNVFVGIFAQAGMLPGPVVLQPYLRLVLLLLLPVGLALLALHLWMLERMEPMRQIEGLLVTPQAPVPAGAGSTPFVLPRSGARRSAEARGPDPLLADRRGLGWAAVSYALQKLRFGGIREVRVSYGVPLVRSVAILTWCVMDPGSWWLVTCLGFPLLLQQSILHVENPQRLYMLGVDYRTQLLHFLKTFWLTADMLVISPGVLLAVALDFRPEAAAAVLAQVAGITLLGAGWLRWPDMPQAVVMMGQAGCSVLLAFLLLLGIWLGYLIAAGRLDVLPDPGWSQPVRAMLFGAACAALGLAGVLHKVFWLNEDRLREVLLDSTAVSQRN
jgi:hypothetical protein